MAYNLENTVGIRRITGVVVVILYYYSSIYYINNRTQVELGGRDGYFQS